MMQKERDQYRAMLVRVSKAWATAWDCSASPGHQEMHNAIGEVESLLRVP
jgi:hypothetical protein